MSQSNKPQPLPRISRNSTHQSERGQTTPDKTCLTSNSGQESLNGCVDILKMNEEICRYRLASKERRIPSVNPSTDSLSLQTHIPPIDNDAVIEDLNRQLKDALEKNDQWVTYDGQREEYVKSLHIKYNDLNRRYQEMNESYNQIRNNPSCLSVEQRRYYDGLLVEARGQLTASRKEVLDLKSKIENLKCNSSREAKKLQENIDYLKSLCEKQESQLKKLERDKKSRGSDDRAGNDGKENWDRVSSLQREMELYRQDFSTERSKRESLERRIENLQMQIKHQEIYKAKYTPQSSHRTKKNSKSSSSRSNRTASSNPQSILKVKPIGREEKHAVVSDRRSIPIDPTHVTIRRKKSKDHEKTKVTDDRLNRTYNEFGRHDESNLSCPICGKIYAVDEHELLLSHIDSCV